MKKYLLYFLVSFTFLSGLLLIHASPIQAVYKTGIQEASIVFPEQMVDEEYTLDLGDKHSGELNVRLINSVKGKYKLRAVAYVSKQDIDYQEFASKANRTVQEKKLSEAVQLNKTEFIMEIGITEKADMPLQYSINIPEDLNPETYYLYLTVESVGKIKSHYWMNTDTYYKQIWATKKFKLTINEPPVKEISPKEKSNSETIINKLKDNWVYVALGATAIISVPAIGMALFLAFRKRKQKRNNSRG